MPHTHCISVVSWRTVTIIVLIGKSEIKKNKTLPSVTGIIVNAGIGLHMLLAPEVMTFASAHLLRDSTSREQVCLYLSTLSQREPIIIGHGGWSDQFFHMCRRLFRLQISPPRLQSLMGETTELPWTNQVHVRSQFKVKSVYHFQLTLQSPTQVQKA